MRTYGSDQKDGEQRPRKWAGAVGRSTGHVPGAACRAAAAGTALTTYFCCPRMPSLPLAPAPATEFWSVHEALPPLPKAPCSRRSSWLKVGRRTLWPPRDSPGGGRSPHTLWIHPVGFPSMSVSSQLETSRSFGRV